MGSKSTVSLTLDTHLLERLRAFVAKGDLSAFVNDTLRQRLSAEAYKAYQQLLADEPDLEQARVQAQQSFLDRRRRYESGRHGPATAAAA